MFLSKLLPSKGVYCVAMLNPGRGFKHFFFKQVSAAQERLQALDRAGHTAYVAQASFDQQKINEAREFNKTLKGLSLEEYNQKKKKIRGQVNTAYLKNFFLDIDCGEKWPVKNQKEGVAALKKFLADTDLPFPTVVSSGNGLYAHWILKKEIPAGQWRTVAYILKNVVAKYSPEIGGDSSRTADCASVLRVPGTFNRKPGKQSKRVVLLRESEPVVFMDFVRTLSKAAKKKKINITKVKEPKTLTDINSDFFEGLEQKSAPANAAKIADSCAQLDVIRTTCGDVAEPLWYACLGILVHCADGDNVAQEWSKGHAEYSPSSTVSKLSQWRNAGVGPSTCANLGSVNPASCIGCRYNGQIKSPIVLGRPDPEKKDVPVDQVEPPEGFRRSKDGLYAEQDGRWVKFYDQDLCPSKLAYDESLGYEIMIIKHFLPFEGEMTCSIRSSLVNDPKILINVLTDNHIKVVGAKSKKLLAAYMESYAAKLQRNRRMSMLLCQMGWKVTNNKEIFVLGKKIYHRDGSVDNASLAKNVPRSAEGFSSRGSLDKWITATEVLNKPGMEPFAFALLAGGFGAPLMKFTGFDGAMVSLVGKTGAGKTLILRWIQSVWGYHNDLMMLRDDTKNALVSRLGVYGNLPLTVDEVTNTTGMELSDLVYRVTQGRDKARLTKNSEEKKLINKWNTLAVTSSNASLVDKLASAKHDASAEINRVFEYFIHEHPEFSGKVTTNLYWTLDKNYGLAGEVYAKWLVQNIETIETSLRKIKEKIDLESDMQGDERFWSAVMAVAIFGGLVAKKLGLIRFDINRILKWATDAAISMRYNKREYAGDPIDTLGQFIDEQAANRLVVTDAGRGKKNAQILEEPRGPLVMRFEVDKSRLYFSRNFMRKWLDKKFGSYHSVKNGLIESGILLSISKRKILGSGTTYGGAQQTCWEIDTSNPRLGQSMRDYLEALRIAQATVENSNFKP